MEKKDIIVPKGLRYVGELDSEGERVPDAYDPLGWGGFTVEFN